MQYQLLPSLAADEYEALRNSIIADGVKVPVEYDEAHNILDGHHRVMICQELGIVDWPRIVRIGMSEEEKIEHVLTLNLDRRHLTREQRKELVATLRSQGWSTRKIAARVGVTQPTVIADLAGDRNLSPAHVTGQDGKSYPARREERASPSVSIFNPSPADIVKAQEIYRSGDEELINEMDRTGKVEPVLRKLKRRENAERLSSTPSFPDNKYRIIYADPPWKYNNTMPDYFTEQADHYPLLSIQELIDLPIKDLAHDNAVLFLWVTSPILEEAFQVINAWGFKYKSSFVWDKIKHNMGHYNSVRHEFLLICVRGSCQPDVRKLFDSVLSIERTEHSVKPEEFRVIIDTIYPNGKRIELFARRKAQGWDTYGNEIVS